MSKLAHSHAPTMLRLERERIARLGLIDEFPICPRCGETRDCERPEGCRDPQCPEIIEEEQKAA